MGTGTMGLGGLYLQSIRLDEPLSAESWLKRLPVVRWLEEAGELEFTAPVTIFVGENGSGKSTLLEACALLMGFNAEGGSRNFDFSTRDSHSKLHEYLHATKGFKPRDGFFLRAESFYNAATYIDQADVIKSYGGISLHAQSHGESFMTLVQERFRGHGLYLLDEPEAALSPSRLLQLICRIDQLVEDESQFIIATHSPILMAFPGAQVLEFTQNGVHPVDYQQTEHFAVTRTFLNDPERMLRELLG